MRKITAYITAAVLMCLTACGSVSENTEVKESSALADALTDAITVNKAEKSGNVIGTGMDLRGELGITSIVSITFLDTLKDSPDDAWDISETQDGSVLAWAEEEAEGKYYDLYVAGEGGVDAPEDSSNLFRDYKMVTEINFNECFYTGDVTDMEDLFMSCLNVKSLDLRSWDTSKVTKMTRMFYNNYDLVDLKFDDFDTSNVTTFYAMFYDCRSLSELDLSSWDVSKVEYIDFMFKKCSSLEKLNLSGWNTVSIGMGNSPAEAWVGMDNLFQECSSLKKLDVSNWNTSNAVSMDGIFSGCSSIKSLDLSSWDVSSVTSMKGMFYGCSELTDLNIDGWDLSNVENKETLFAGTPLA